MKNNRQWLHNTMAQRLNAAAAYAIEMGFSEKDFAAKCHMAFRARRKAVR